MSEQIRLTEKCSEIINKFDSSDFTDSKQEDAFTKSLDRFVKEIDKPQLIELYSLEHEFGMLRNFQANIIQNWKDRAKAVLDGLQEAEKAAGKTILINFQEAISLIKLIYRKGQDIESGKRPLASWPTSVLSNYYEIIWSLREIDDSIKSMEKDFANADADRISMRIVTQRPKMLAVSNIIGNLSKLGDAPYPELREEVCKLNTELTTLVETYKQQVSETQKAALVLNKYDELLPRIKQFYLDTVKRCMG